MEDIIHKGMVAGAPFPSLYEWTWGEVIELIVCYNERMKMQERDQAVLMFKQSALIAKMMLGRSGATHSVIDSFDHLWTEEERAQIHYEMECIRMEQYLKAHTKQD